jgi:hypothetical protein
MFHRWLDLMERSTRRIPPAYAQAQAALTQ